MPQTPANESKAKCPHKMKTIKPQKPHTHTPPHPHTTLSHKIFPRTHTRTLSSLPSTSRTRAMITLDSLPLSPSPLCPYVRPYPLAMRTDPRVSAKKNAKENERKHPIPPPPPNFLPPPPQKKRRGNTTRRVQKRRVATPERERGVWAEWWMQKKTMGARVWVRGIQVFSPLETPPPLLCCIVLLPTTLHSDLSFSRTPPPPPSPRSPKPPCVFVRVWSEQQDVSCSTHHTVTMSEKKDLRGELQRRREEEKEGAPKKKKKNTREKKESSLLQNAAAQ